MKQIVQRLKKALVRLRGRYSSPLPQGMDEFNAWCDSIINSYELPTKEVDSIKFTLSTAIMHLKATDASVPKQYFVTIIKAAAAKQVAGACFTEIKERQKQIALKQAEDTAKAQAAPSDGLSV